MSQVTVAETRNRVTVLEDVVVVSVFSAQGPPGRAGTDANLYAVSVTTGDGLSGGGTLEANLTLTVDSTVVRTSGDQTIAGLKTFSNHVSISGSVTSVDSIQLDLANSIGDLTAGQLSWNEDSNTVSVGLDVGTLELGQETHIYVKNQSGTTIGKGNTVMFAGTLGNSGRILVQKAIMDGTYPSSYFIGLAKHNIINGGDGYVTTFGSIDRFDTSMFSEGDILYADPGVAGGLSNTAPVAPNNFVTVAAVINSDDNQGKLFIRPTFLGTLVDKEDVYAPAISDNNTLVWSTANSRFEARSVRPARHVENVGVVVSNILDLSTGNFFSHTPAANTAYVFNNAPAAGTAYSFTLVVTPSATITIDWPSTVKWSNGIVPEAPANGETDVFTFYTQDGGAAYYGFQIGNAMA